MASIGMSLAAQYDRAWEMMKATISRFSAEQWRSGSSDLLIPARWAFHAVEAVDFYARSHPDGFPRGERFGTGWRDAASILPSQEAMLEYLEEVSAGLRKWLLSASDDELLRTPNAFPWTGDNVLERMEYTLRHTMYHLGEMSMLLRLNGAEETEWR